MKAHLQRVARARVTVSGEVAGEIGRGYLVLLGVEKGDLDRDATRLAEKIRNLRLFPDAGGRLDRDLLEVGGKVLSVSQFTLLADCRKGRRPGFSRAEDPLPARALWESFNRSLEGLGVPVETGRFGEDMQVELVNDGPLTILLDTREF